MMCANTTGMGLCRVIDQLRSDSVCRSLYRNYLAWTTKQLWRKGRFIKRTLKGRQRGVDYYLYHCRWHPEGSHEAFNLTRGS
jgi:hypothetical protein